MMSSILRVLPAGLHLPLVVAFALVQLSACVTRPVAPAWRPWNRVLHGPGNVPAGSVLQLEVSGETGPLLGSEDLVAASIAATAKGLLERRGFRVADAATEHRCAITYRTMAAEPITGNTLVPTGITSTAWVASSSRISRGLGVTVARELSTVSVTTTPSSIGITALLHRYEHVLALEITDSQQALLWKGEATWISRDLDIRGDLPAGLQVLMSQLPYNPDHPPRVRAIRAEKEGSFYRTFVNRRWFSCPALPSKIAFDSLPADINYLFADAPKAVDSIQDTEALAAYLDLVQTAEFAVPLGAEDYSDPLASRLWSKVRLGGPYVLEPAGETVYVLMTLREKSGGYLVEQCHLVDRRDYSEFEESLEKWQEALRAYFDFYE